MITFKREILIVLAAGPAASRLYYADRAIGAISCFDLRGRSPDRINKIQFRRSERVGRVNLARVSLSLSLFLGRKCNIEKNYTLSDTAPAGESRFKW